jgi:hypothetical protein
MDMNKFQLGTILPQTQAIPFQYTPLGLEAFAQPIAMKQQRFDTVLGAVEDTEFNIEHLSGDKQSQEKLKQELEEHKAALLADLDKTSNYKDAARRLKTLNKIYNSDAEITGIRNQAASFAAEDKVARERIDGKTYTQDDYEKWKFKALNSYNEQGGLNFDRATGNYTPIDVSQRGDNLEKEIRDDAQKSAKSTPMQIRETYGDIDPGTMSRIETLYKERSLDPTATHQGIALEIENWLKQSDRYKNFIEEKAEYDFYYDSRHNPNFIDDVLSNQEARYEDTMSIYSQLAQQPEVGSDKREEYQNIVKKLGRNYNEFLDLKEQAQASNKMLPLAEQLYIENVKGDYLGDVARAAGDLVDVSQVKFNIKEGGSGSGSGVAKKLENIENLEVNTSTIDYSAKNAPIIQGGSTSALDVTEQEKIFNKGQAELVRDFDFPHRDSEAFKASQIISNDDNINLLKEEDQTKFRAVSDDANDFYTLMKRDEKFEKSIEDKDLQIEELRKVLSTGTANEIAEATSKITGLNQDKEEIKLQREAEFNEIDNLLDEAYPVVTGGNRLVPELDNFNLTTATRQEKYKAFYNLYKDQLVSQSNLFSTERAASSQVESDLGTLEEVRKQEELEKQQRLQDEGTLAEVGKVSLSETPTEFTLSIFNASYPSHTAIQTLRNSLTARSAATTHEVIVDEHSNAFTEGTLKKITDEFEKNPPGSDGAGKVVNFDAATGKITYLPKVVNYNLENYEKPAYEGRAKGPEENTIDLFRYNRMPLDKAEIAKIIKRTKTTEGEVTNEEVREWKQNNPQTMVLASIGKSYNVDQKAAKTFTEYAGAAIAGDNPYAFETVLNSYSAINILTDPDRRKRYNQMSSSLQQLIKQKNTNRVLTQTPNIWQSDGETSSGYFLDYRYEPDPINKELGKIIVDVSQITINNATGEQLSNTPVTTHTMPGINSQSIRAMDVFYGVGNDDDVVRNPQANLGEDAFLPASFLPLDYLKLKHRYGK